ncbi:MAG: (Na+)-NQR maturation NqrM [Gammaproteobacteria bacterium]|nr:MAG: (Na+)-NQR maturation NqrM [Gammaproteobacteria bacterium]
MSQFLVVFVIMLALVAAMSIGVMLGRKPIAGTCGGLNMMGADGSCDICGGDPSRCDAEDEADDGEAPRPLGYDATRR